MIRKMCACGRQSRAELQEGEGERSEEEVGSSSGFGDFELYAFVALWLIDRGQFAGNGAHKVWKPAPEQVASYARDQQWVRDAKLRSCLSEPDMLPPIFDELRFCDVLTNVISSMILHILTD